MAAVEFVGADRLFLCGGVAANSGLRGSLGSHCEAKGIKLHVPPMELCTDNAAMIASAARYTTARPFPDYLALDAYATRRSAV